MVEPDTVNKLFLRDSFQNTNLKKEKKFDDSSKNQKPSIYIFGISLVKLYGRYWNMCPHPNLHSLKKIQVSNIQVNGNKII